MTVAKPLIDVFVVLFLTGLFFFQETYATNTEVMGEVQDSSVAPPLTKEKIRDFIKTCMATFQLQEKMKANAGQYDDVIQAFYKKRKALLKGRGWTVENFENTQTRIFAAKNAMEEEASLESEPEFKADIAEINANSRYSEKQKSQVIAMMRKDRKRILDDVIKPTKPDWPAVKAYGKELDHLTAYVAKNRTDPPVVE